MKIKPGHRMSKKQEKVLKELFVEELKKQRGLINLTLEIMDLSDYFYKKWYNSDSEFKTNVDMVQTINLERIESKIFELIDKGNVKMIEYYLNNMSNGKYSNKQHIEQNTTLSAPVELNIVVPKQIETDEKKKLK